VPRGYYTKMLLVYDVLNDGSKASMLCRTLEDLWFSDFFSPKLGNRLTKLKNCQNVHVSYDRFLGAYSSHFLIILK
jgi:hypothetical protein